MIHRIVEVVRDTVRRLVRSEHQPELSRKRNFRSHESKRSDRPELNTTPAQSSSPGGSRPIRSSSERSARRQKPKWNIARFPVEPLEGKTRFHDLNLPNSIMHVIADLDFRYCTPIQAEILPSALSGKDATGQAQTGTGKTAAFLITIFTHVLRNRAPGGRKNGTPRALVLAPTRELVMQISKDAQSLSKYCPVKTVSVFGGLDYRKQKQQLSRERVDVIVATPGRLLDFLENHIIDLSKVEILVVDEADRMLDMGFIPDVRRIIHETPPKTHRQTLLFSATLPEDVIRLASSWTTNPVTVEIQPEQVAVDTVEQVVYVVTTEDKFALLYNLLTRQNFERVIIFNNRRDDSRKLADLLHRYGISCRLLTGEVPQKKRIQTLENFRAGKFRVLVATDVAGRGLHIEDVSHVINYTLPSDPEDYVHRIGRTGRAGATGTSISFACEEGSFQLPQIEEFLGHPLACTHPEDEWLELPLPPERPASLARRKKGKAPLDHRRRNRNRARNSNKR